MKGFTFYKGVRNYDELIAFMENDPHGEMPECESFKCLTAEGEGLADGYGYIAEEDFDDDLYEELPETLEEALGMTMEDRVRKWGKEWEVKNGS